MRLQSVGGTGQKWLDKDTAFFGKKFGVLMGKQVSARSEALHTFMRDRVTRFRDGAVCAWIKTASLPVKTKNGSSYHTVMEIGKLEGLTLLMVPVAVQHGGQSSTKAVRKGSLPLRYSNRYAQSQTGNTHFQDVNGGAAPLQLVHYNNGQGTNANAMAVPGYVSEVRTEFATPGEYAMPCHEFCGLSHHTMWATVKVVDPKDMPKAERASCVQN